MLNYSSSVILLSCQSFTLWSSSEPGMLRWCCVWSRCPVLCGVVPFNVRQPPNLTSYFQKVEGTSCFLNLVLLSLRNTQPALGLLNVTLTRASRSGNRLIMPLYQNIYFFLSVSCSGGKYPNKTKKGCATVLCRQLPPRVRTVVQRLPWFPWIR